MRSCGICDGPATCVLVDGRSRFYACDHCCSHEAENCAPAPRTNDELIAVERAAEDK